MRLVPKFVLFLMILLVSPCLLAWDNPETVRLGGRIIEPGISKVELIKAAGAPMLKEDSGIDPNTGIIQEIWYYEFGGGTAMIRISNGVVRSVSVTK
jgi:hypothetical protein